MQSELKSFLKSDARRKKLFFLYFLKWVKGTAKIYFSHQKIRFFHFFAFLYLIVNRIPLLYG